MVVRTGYTVAMIQYFDRSGATINDGSRTPAVPKFDTRTGSPLFKVVHEPGLLLLLTAM
jgi:hypothetical protein